MLNIYTKKSENFQLGWAEAMHVIPVCSHTTFMWKTEQPENVSPQNYETADPPPKKLWKVLIRYLSQK